MNSVFDYIFYRLAKFYYKWDGSTANTAVIGISLAQTLYISSFIIYPTIPFFTRAQTSPYARLMGFCGATFLVFMTYINTKKFKNKYPSLRNKWANEPKAARRIKGLLVLIFMITPLLSMLYLGSLP